MKYIEIAEKIDKSKQNEDWINTEDIGYELGIEIPYLNQEKLKAYWVGSWYCTDSYVGYRMYFLEDEPVAFSSQQGRKCDEHFKWFSLEAAQNVKQYLLSLLTEQEDTLNVDICDVQEEVGVGYKIDFNSQVLNSKNVSYNAEKIEILHFDKKHPYGIDSTLTIKLSSGEEKEVDIKSLVFGFHLNEEVLENN